MSSFPNISDPYASFIKKTLPNGLEIHSAHQPDKPWTAVRMVVHTGAQHDPRDLPGLAHFVEHMVASNLPGKDPDNTIAWFEKTGCGCSLGSTNCFSTVYRFRLPNNAHKISRALEIFGSMLRQSPLDENLEKERSIIKREYDKRYPIPKELEWNLDIASNVFPGLWLENYDRPLGALKSIESITESNIQSFYRKFYVPGNISIVTVGGLSQDQIVELIANSPFGTPGDNQRNPILKPVETLPKVRSPLLEVSTADIANGQIDRAKLVLTWSYPSYITEEARGLFCDVMDNKMSEILREKHRVVYSTSQSCTDYHDIGEYAITLVPDPARVDKTLGLLHECIESAATDLKLFRQNKLSRMRRFAMRDNLPGIDLADNATRSLQDQHRITTLEEDYRHVHEIRFDEMAKMASYLTKERGHTFILRP